MELFLSFSLESALFAWGLCVASRQAAITFSMFLLASGWWVCLCLGSSDIRSVGKGKDRDGVDGGASCIYPPSSCPGAQQKLLRGRLCRVEATRVFIRSTYPAQRFTALVHVMFDPHLAHTRKPFSTI